jgi:hypothetical protein
MTRRTTPALCALLVLALAGCSGIGGGGSETLSGQTKHGLSFSLKITDSGSATKECTTSSYRTALPDGRPITQGSHACGRAILYGYPLLVQARTSAESMVVDVPKSGCGKVTGHAGSVAPQPLVARCTSGEPKFRVTIIPAGRRLVIKGIPGAPVLNFPRHVCKTGICLTPLG